MNNNLEKLKKEAQLIRMSSAEKRSIRDSIFGVPSTSPARAVRSPYAYASFFSFRMAVSFAAVLLIVVGSTTAYAAQGALPGDALYTIKIHVNEPTMGTLAFTAHAKADYHTGIVERRMEEAETLASTGRLDAKAEEAIKASLATHVAAADSIAEMLEGDDPDAAAEVSARFSSSLSAHSAILSRLGDDSDNDDTKKNSGALAMYVRDNVESSSRWSGRRTLAAKAPEAQSVSLAVSTTADASSTKRSKDSTSRTADSKNEASTSDHNESQRSSEQAAASHLRNDAQDALEETQNVYDDAQGSLDATTTQQVKAKLKAIEGYVEAGEQLEDADSFGEAQEQFTRALKESVRLEALIKANKKFDNKNILRNLLWEHRSGDDDSQQHENDNDNEEDNHWGGDDDDSHGQGGLHLDSAAL